MAFQIDVLSVQLYFAVSGFQFLLLYLSQFVSLTNGVTVTLSHDNKVITWDCLDDDRCFLLARCCFDVSPQFSANLRQPFHVETGLYNCI